MKEEPTPPHNASQHIPTPLRDWLDKAILSAVTDSTAAKASAEGRKSRILDAILYPLKATPKKSGIAH